MTATTFTVTSALDPSDRPRLTLREALAMATTPGDIVQFNIAPAGAHIILTNSTLTVPNGVIVDGTTQPGYTGTPLIVSTPFLSNSFIAISLCAVAHEMH